MSETRPKRSSRRLGVNSESGGVAAGQQETQPGMFFIMCKLMGSGEAFSHLGARDVVVVSFLTHQAHRSSYGLNFWLFRF